MKAVIVFALALVACAAADPVPMPAPYVDAACQRAVDFLRRDKAQGLPCPIAKARVLAAEPQCPLAFTCPEERDAGSDR